MFGKYTTAEPYLQPFPELEAVFAAPLDLHRKHFLPLVSVDVSTIYDDLDLWLHFVTPIEPLLELVVGDHTKEYHDFYNKANQVAFHVGEGKYTFAGDFNYFAYESGAIYKKYPDYGQQIQDDYQLRLDTYAAAKMRFREYGRLYSRHVDITDPEQLSSVSPFVDRLGGEVAFGNWGMSVPVNKSGEPFRFIGELTGFLYADGAADSILLFYDPAEQIALVTFDWT